MNRILTVKGKLFYFLSKVGKLIFVIAILAFLVVAVSKMPKALTAMIEGYIPILGGGTLIIKFPYHILVNYYTPEHCFTRLDKIHKRLLIVFESMLMAGGVTFIAWRIFNLQNSELFTIWCESFLVILAVPFVFYIVGKYRKDKAIRRIVSSLGKGGR